MIGVASLRWWDLAAAGMAFVLVGVTAVGHLTGDATVWGGVLVLAGSAVLYVGLGRRLLRRQEYRLHVLLTVSAAVLVALAVAHHPLYALLQALVYPLIWTTSVNLRGALAANPVIAVAVVTGYLLHGGLAEVWEGLGVAVISLVFSLAMGLWIVHVDATSTERAELIAHLRAAQDQVADLHRDAGAVAERERIARDLHDTIAQTLTGIVMVAQRADARASSSDVPSPVRSDISLVEEMARDALREARGLVTVLSPIELDTTLADALARLGERFTRETGVRVSTDVAADLAGLGREGEVILLRAAQEGLANVRKHARAHRAWVRVRRLDGVVRLVVLDDGAGPVAVAEPGTPGRAPEPSPEAGFGISGLRNRLSAVGGTVSLEAVPGGGARLTVVVPSESHEEAPAARHDEEVTG